MNIKLKKNFEINIITKNDLNNDKEKNYTDNFGYQWNKYRKTQIDDNLLQSSKIRFFNETNFTKEDLDNKNILEVGSGAGRFTNIIMKYSNANLHSVDSSTAVYANFENNKLFIDNKRLKIYKCTLYDMPFIEKQFDIVLCLGVLQHTPNIKETIISLTDQLKKGGTIVIDFYPYKGFWTYIHAKYLFRFFTTKMNNKKLHNFIDSYIDVAIKFYLFLNKIGLHFLTRFIPIPDLKKTFPLDIEYNKLREMVLLDTFDMLSPKFDRPQKIKTVTNILKKNNIKILFSGIKKYSFFSSAVVKGIRK